MPPYEEVDLGGSDPPGRAQPEYVFRHAAHDQSQKRVALFHGVVRATGAGLSQASLLRVLGVVLGL